MNEIKIKAKIVKLKVMSERGGTEGERDNAKKLLINLCKKHNIDIESLNEEQKEFLVKYADGVSVNFRNEAPYHDQRMPDGRVNRYYRNGEYITIIAPVRRRFIRVHDNGTATTNGLGGAFGGLGGFW